MFLSMSVWNTLNILIGLKGPQKNAICTKDDVRGDVLGPLHGTTQAAIIANKNIGLILWKQ